jgi:hypothetical protein
LSPGPASQAPRQILDPEYPTAHAQVTKIWKQMTAGIDDVPARAEMLTRQAASKYKRMVEEGEAEASKVLGKFKEKAGVLRKKAQDLQRTKMDAMEGWYVPVDEDGSPVMGVAGNVTGFDDKGKLVGDIETLPAGLRFTFKYDITANVDEVVFAEREWLVPRVAELLARENPVRCNPARRRAFGCCLERMPPPPLPFKNEPVLPTRYVRD